MDNGDNDAVEVSAGTISALIPHNDIPGNDARVPTNLERADCPESTKSSVEYTEVEPIRQSLPVHLEVTASEPVQSVPKRRRRNAIHPNSSEAQQIYSIAAEFMVRSISLAPPTANLPIPPPVDADVQDPKRHRENGN